MSLVTYSRTGNAKIKTSNVELEKESLLILYIGIRGVFLMML